MLIAAGLVMAVLSGCATLFSPKLAGLVTWKHKPFSIQLAQKSYGWGFLSHPFMTSLSDGAVLIRYNVAGDSPTPKIIPELQELTPAYSSDEGTTWHFGLNSLPPAEREWTHHLGVVKTPNGFLRHTYIMHAGPSNDVVIQQSDGQVKRLYSTCRLPDGVQSFYPSLKGCVYLSNGDIVMAGHTRFPGDSKSRVILLRSTDGGLTFEYDATIATAEDAPWGKQWPVGFEGPGECSMVGLENDELLCVMRVGIKQANQWEQAKDSLRMLQARSKDKGRTWECSCLAFGGVYPKLLRMSNGVLVLAFGRRGNNLVFSVNGGRIWGKEIALTYADVRTSGYCDIIEVRPGRLLAVYDLYNTDPVKIWLWEPTEINGVFGVYVDVYRCIGGASEAR